jgi:hypothetical protein
MSLSPGPSAAFQRRELDAVRRVVLMRLPQHTAEWHRLQRMRALIDAASELSRVLASHTRCTLVDCGGSQGTGDLAAETERLFEALERYADVVRDIAVEYDRFADALPMADHHLPDHRRSMPPQRRLG